MDLLTLLGDGRNLHEKRRGERPPSALEGQEPAAQPATEGTTGSANFREAPGLEKQEPPTSQAPSDASPGGQGRVKEDKEEPQEEKPVTLELPEDARRTSMVASARDGTCSTPGFAGGNRPLLGGVK